MRRWSRRSPSRPVVTLVSVDDSPALAWQADLLRFSHGQARQPGALEVLTSVTALVPPYPAANRPHALARWAAGRRETDDPSVIVMDPDMLFVEPLVPASRRGTVVAQDGGFPVSPDLRRALGRHVARPQAARALIPPVVLPASDLAVLAPVWLRLTLALHADPQVRALAGWLVEMWAFSLAVATTGLRVREETTAAIPPRPHAGGLPVVHYAVATPCFDKRTYRPWSDLPACPHPGHVAMRAVLRRMAAAAVVERTPS